MISAPFLAFRPRACFVASLFLAGLLSALSVDNALAGTITYDNNVFTGDSTDFTAVGNQSFPYTDSFGRDIDVSGEVFGIYRGYGINAYNGALIFSNFASGTTDFGFHVSTTYEPGSDIVSVEFSNGDSYSGPLQINYGNTFYHFSDTASFTSVTVTFTGGTNTITDFRTAAATSSVPEPSSLALLAAGAMFAGVSAWRRRKTS